MQYTCEYCQKTFNNNAGLYDHKEREHKTPSIVLVNHNFHDVSPRNILLSSSDDNASESSDASLLNIPRKRRARGDHADDSHTAKKWKHDEKLDPPTNIPRKRRAHGNHADDSFTSKKWKHGGEQVGSPGGAVNENVDYRRLYLKSLKQLKKLNGKYTSLRGKYDKMEEACDQRLMKKMDEKDLHHQVDIEDMVTEYKKHLSGVEGAHQALIEQLERDCEIRVRDLNKQVVDMKDEGYSNFNALSKAIFNCVTIQDIHKIRDLVNTQNVGEISTKHIETIQKIMLGLSVGVIPICNPQRTIINDSQRRLIKELQDAPASAAKRKLKNNHSNFTRLWSIIDDSLGLVCRTYNRYGSRDEDDDEDL